jgi:predicted ATP-binding protein involved in virulence
MKLRKLHIEDYKMFKDFDIRFVDENDEALPIVVLAGLNGSGKTSLLECLNLKYNISGQMQILFQGKKINFSIKNKDIKSYTIRTGYVSQNIYFPTSTTLENIKILLPKYIEDMIFVKGIAPFDTYRKVTKYINEILKDLKIGVEFDSRDGDGNLFFRNKSGGDKFSIDELSTGEKTLLSKVLYLYLEDIKDKVILIDEPELSLHPSWQNKVLKIYENFAKQNNCQIIIATHSPHIIGSAKNEYLRILRKNDDGNIEVINNSMAYGRDIEWVLEEVMGVPYTREKNILLKIEACQDLIENEEYDKAEKAINNLEDIIGENDSEILTLRNSLAFERIDFEEDN